MGGTSSTVTREKTCFPCIALIIDNVMTKLEIILKF